MEPAANLAPSITNRSFTTSSGPSEPEGLAPAGRPRGCCGWRPLQACPHQSQPSAKPPVLTFLSKLVLVAYIAAKLQAGAEGAVRRARRVPLFPGSMLTSPQAPAQGVLGLLPRRRPRTPRPPYRPTLLHLERHPGLRSQSPALVHGGTLGWHCHACEKMKYSAHVTAQGTRAAAVCSKVVLRSGLPSPSHPNVCARTLRDSACLPL